MVFRGQSLRNVFGSSGLLSLDGPVDLIGGEVHAEVLMGAPPPPRSAAVRTPGCHENTVPAGRDGLQYLPDPVGGHRLEVVLAGPATS
jgi:hypothetical protein